MPHEGAPPTLQVLKLLILNHECAGTPYKRQQSDSRQQEATPDEGGAEKNKILRSEISRNHEEALGLQRPGY